MKYTCENKLFNFDAWAGGKDVLEALCGNAYETVSDYLESLSYEIELTEGEINDWLWFECEDWLHEECGMNLDGSTYFEDED